MIPYVTIEKIPIINSDPFSFFLFLAYVAGYLMITVRCVQYGYSKKIAAELLCFTAIPPLFGAHLFHYLAYSPAELIKNPRVLLQATSGLASLGGIISFFFFFYLYLRLSGRLAEWRTLLDIDVQGFIVGLAVGRIGCALIHDHMGVASDFILAVQTSAGSRHDLGLYELLFLVLFLFPVSYFIHRTKQRPGSQLFWFILFYGAFRILVEFLRSYDPRYLGFTPAQYASFFLLLALVFIVKRKILFENNKSS